MLRRWVVLSGILVLAGCQGGNLRVPIGDPEMSRVKPELTGVWQVIEPIEVEEAEAQPETAEAQPEAAEAPEEEGRLQVAMVDPYDKRTWIVRQIWLSAKRKLPADIAEIDRWIGSPMDQVTVCNAMKVWIARLGGVDFAVAEPQFPLSEEHGFKQEDWLVFRLEIRDRDVMTLEFLDREFKVGESGTELGKVTSRREAERMIRRNANNPALYGGKSGGGIRPHWELRRLPSHAHDELRSAMEGRATRYSWCLK